MRRSSTCDPHRTLSIIGLLALAAVLFIAADALEDSTSLPAAILATIIVLWLLVWLVKRLRTRRANRKLGDMLEQQAEVAKAAPAADGKQPNSMCLRTQPHRCSKDIKTSKIGQSPAVPRYTNCRGTS